MSLQSVLCLLGGAALVLAAPQATPKIPAVDAGSPPLPLESAKSIFQTGDRRIHPEVVPHLVPFKPTIEPLPLRPSETPKATVSHVPIPAKASPIVNTPGVPDTGDILVGVNESIPLSKYYHNHFLNSLHNPNLTELHERQSYPNCSPDPRYFSESTSFPYSVTGKWSNPYGTCSGTLVGPRHVLTASHCIDWNGANSWTGSIEFQPDYWPGHSLGTFTSSLLIRYDQTPEGGVTTDFNIAFDYVVAVLDTPPNLGWLGSKTYNPAWNGLAAWYESGYAANAGGAQIPYAQGPFKVVSETGEDNQSDILEYTACATPGDSGSSVFGWWADGPYLIGLLTWQGGLPSGSEADSWGPGGANLPNLINVARTDHP